MLETSSIQIEHSAGCRGGHEYSRGALRMKAAKEEAHGRRIADACSDLVAGDHGGDHVLAARLALLFREGERDRRRKRAGMNDGFLVNVVQLERMASGSIDKRSQGDRSLVTHTEERGDWLPTLVNGEFRDLSCPGQSSAKKAAAEAVQDA